MKVVLLAAGRSIRMKPIADKNFLKFLGKPLIEHQIGALIRASFKDILIMGGGHNLAALKKLVRDKHFKAKITVREQKDLNLGMAGAILSAESFLKREPFLVVSANDVVDPSAYDLVHANLNARQGLIVAYKVSKYFPGGYLKTNPRGVVTKIIEKPGAGHEPSKLVNIVIHYHNEPKLLIEALKKISSKKDDRYECALQELFDKKVAYRALLFNGFWQPVKYPWHVLKLMEYFLNKADFKGKNVEVAKTAQINGNVYLEDGVRVLDNAVICGPAYIGKNSVIATNALVRQSHMGDNCVIGFGSEVARSYVGNNVWTHTNYIGDSIIGNNVSFGAGTVTGNLRLDEKNIFVAVNGDKVDCGSNKFGLITGDNVRAGINTSFMPGVKVGSDSFIGAGIVVAQDIPDSSFVSGDWELKIKPNREKPCPRKAMLS